MKLLAIVSLLSITSGFIFNAKVKRRIDFRRDGTEARPSSESVEPTVYSEDYYGVLGLSHGASLEEIKTSYKKIAFMNHPDRNKSIEALEVFRNASYAYKILNSDQKSIIDTKYRAKKSLDKMEEISTEYLIPLLTFTVKSIGSFTKPVIKDVLEQSAVVIQTALEGDSPDVWARAKQALEVKKILQNIEKMNNTMEVNLKNIQITESEILNSEESIDELINQLQSSEMALKVEINKVKDVIGQENFISGENLTKKTMEIIETNKEARVNRAESLKLRENEISEEICLIYNEILELAKKMETAKEMKIRLEKEKEVVALEIKKDNFKSMEIEINEKVKKQQQALKLFREKMTFFSEKSILIEKKLETEIEKLSTLKNKIENGLAK